MRDEDLEKLRAAYPPTGDPNTKLSKAVGVYTQEVRTLYEEIFRDLDDTAFGVKWWTPHPGTKRRIFASHYLLETVRSIETSLVEAALHHLEAADYYEKESDFLADCLRRTYAGSVIPTFPERTKVEQELPNRMASLHVVGFFRALVGALDCLGASIIGILGLPTDLLRGDLKRTRACLVKAIHPVQVAFLEKVDKAVADIGPTGWLEWLTGYRNMAVHRGRRIHLGMIQPRSGGIYGPDSRIMLRAMWTEQLPSDPDLSQIEAFKLYQESNRAPVLTEPALTTMNGALHSTLELTQVLSNELVYVWKTRRDSPGLILQPKECWPDCDRHLPLCFEGYDPGRIPFDPKQLHAGSDIGTQFKTAALIDELFPLWKSFD